MDMSVDESVVTSFSKETPTRYKDPRNTLLYAAQRGMFEKHTKSPCGFSLLPKYRNSLTPGRKVYNPFKTNVDLLEGHTCSPTVFKKTDSPENGDFTWSIDDISRINPAPIDSPIDLPEEHFDEKMEIKAQQAIERYFSFKHDIVSPAGAPGNWCSPIPGTPASSSTPCNSRSHKPVDACTQTRLSLPPILPPEVEAALKPYFRNDDEADISDECNLSNSTLRRKLFFNKEEESLSPVKKVCYDFGSESDINMKVSRLDWTMNNNSEALSSPDISPIKYQPEPMGVTGTSNEEGIFTSTIISGSQDTGYSTMEQWRSSVNIDSNSN
ncbi:unnamed protein product [Nezara viridula]|uniref:Protein aurora borealis n=1 Tax=Nezara viridula TaxID=85310 RepID=A0A9P0H523_NEZVI|nr:unnamed protein product [Nezara viridula]